MRKIIISFVILLFIPLQFFGQLTPVSDQYVLNPLTINPASAGNRGVLNIAAFYRRQWVGVAGAPETATLEIDTPLRDAKLGIGFMIINDKIGVTKQTAFNSHYSYKILMGEGVLSLGLGAGVITTKTAWSDLVALDPGDDYFLSDSRTFVVPDFRFGSYFSIRNYFAGISIPKLIGYKFNFDKNKYSLMIDPGQYYYMLNTGYIFPVSSSVRFFPSTLVIYSPGENILFDLNAHFNIDEKLWVGVSYRYQRSAGALFQFQINNQLRIAYTYDTGLGKSGRYRNGSHEVMLRYEFRYKLNVVNPLNF